MEKVCMVVFSRYPEDARVRHEAETLMKAGMSVDVLCLREKGEAGSECYNGVHIYRFPISRTRRGKIRYLMEYISFFVLAFIMLSIFHISYKYSLIQIHNMPDFLIFCSIIPKLTGSKILLDLHDPMPEVFMAKYNVGKKHPAIRLLFLIEKLSIWFSNEVITPNIAFEERFISRGCPEWKISIVMNSPDMSIFNREIVPEGSRDGASKRGLRLMFHGTILERHGLDTALEAILILKSNIPSLSFHVYGDGDYVNEFLSQVQRKGLKDAIFYHGYAPLESIPRAISKADIGIIPNKSNVFTEINLPTRIFEYLCMGKPVIAPHTPGILDYFDDGSLFFFEGGNAKSLANVIEYVYRNDRKREEVLRKGIRIYQNYRWDVVKQEYLRIVEGLLTKFHD